MGSRYVPPALRRQQQAIADQNPGVEGEGSPRVENPLPTRKLEDLKISNHHRPHGNPRLQNPDALALEEIHMHFSGRDYEATTKSTLNSSTEQPDRLAYVMLFKDANPRWQSDSIIFAKTNISFLPGYEDAYKQEKATEDSASEHPQSYNSTATNFAESQDIPPYNAKIPETLALIPVFDQILRHGPSGGNFRFVGFHRIERITFLYPHSRELVRMLGQKWDIRDKYGRQKNVQRDKSAWQGNLRTRWAVIKMEKVEMGEKEGKLEIEKFDDPFAVREEALKTMRAAQEVANGLEQDFENLSSAEVIAPGDVSKREEADFVSDARKSTESNAPEP